MHLRLLNSINQRDSAVTMLNKSSSFVVRLIGDYRQDLRAQSSSEKNLSDKQPFNSLNFRIMATPIIYSSLYFFRHEVEPKLPRYSLDLYPFRYSVLY